MAGSGKWTFNTSAGFAASGGIGVASVGFSKAAFVLNSPSGDTVRFDYVSMGGGAGISAPVSITVSGEDFPSEGEVLAVNNNSTLSADDLTGLAFVSEVSIGGLTVAWTGSALFLGMTIPDAVKDYAARMATLASDGAALGILKGAVGYVARHPSPESLLTSIVHEINPAMLIQSAKALLLMDGVSAGFSLGIGASGSLALVSTRYFEEIKFDLQVDYPVQLPPVHYAPNDDSIINLPGNVLFDFDKWKIKSAAGPMLKNAAEIIKARAGYRIVVSGYTCTVGENTAHGRAYNLHLSQRRADAVRQYLVHTCSCDPDNIEAQGLGPKYPVDTNSTRLGRIHNRRVEIAFVKKQNA